jgi:hypothetical protein
MCWQSWCKLKVFVPPRAAPCHLGQVGLSGGLVCKRTLEKEKARVKQPHPKVDKPHEGKSYLQRG